MVVERIEFQRRMWFLENRLFAGWDNGQMFAVQVVDLEWIYEMVTNA